MFVALITGLILSLSLSLSPVACFVATGQMKTAKWLIDSDVAGTLVTSKDNNGDTPAHDAADNGSVSLLH